MKGKIFGPLFGGRHGCGFGVDFRIVKRQVEYGLKLFRYGLEARICFLFWVIELTFALKGENYVKRI